MIGNYVHITALELDFHVRVCDQHHYDVGTNLLSPPCWHSPMEQPPPPSTPNRFTRANSPQRMELANPPQHIAPEPVITSNPEDFPSFRAAIDQYHYNEKYQREKLEELDQEWDNKGNHHQREMWARNRASAENERPKKPSTRPQFWYWWCLDMPLEPPPGQDHDEPNSLPYPWYDYPWVHQLYPKP